MIDILVVDEHALYRECLVATLKYHCFNVYGAVSHFNDCLETIRPNNLPQIAIVSYKTTRPDALQLLQWLRRNYPAIKIIINTLHSDRLPVALFKQMRIEGVIVKSKISAELIQGVIHSVYNGHIFYLFKNNTLQN